MKLQNQSLIFLSIPILAIVTGWAFIFYFSMLHEIKSSMDEGLENYKRLIILNAGEDSTILTKIYFDESFFKVRKIGRQEALSFKDEYVDTVLNMQDADDEAPEAEPVRMLITAFELNGDYYELTVANSMVEEDDLIKELFFDIFWLYLSLMIGIVLVNYFVLRKLWNPFYDFLGKLKNFRLGKESALPETTSHTQEFRDLQTTVNSLLKRTIETFEQQKQFIGNASHELQTPLAIATNKLELLLEEGSLADEQAKPVAEVMEIIDRLVQLNKSLLLLTKIENKLYLEQQQVAVHKVIEKNITEWQEIAAFKNVVIKITRIDEMEVTMDASLAHVVISNLLKNAVIHNLPEGEVFVTLKENRLRICNTGIPRALDGNRIFHRFYRPENRSKGTGLGLAIAKAIADLYGFQLSYTYEDSLHCFSVDFSHS